MIRKAFVVAVLVCSSVFVPALAQEGYVGASYLSSSAEFDTFIASFNPDGDGWKIFAGYNINKYFGIEGTYYDLGGLEDTEGLDTFSADIDAFDVSFRGILPLGKVFQLTAKIGYASVSIDSAASSPLLTVTAEGSEWEVLYGVGAEVKLGKSFGVRADWEFFDVEGELDAWSVGGFFRFGKK